MEMLHIVEEDAASRERTRLAKVCQHTLDSNPLKTPLKVEKESSELKAMLKKEKEEREAQELSRAKATPPKRMLPTPVEFAIHTRAIAGTWRASGPRRSRAAPHRKTARAGSCRRCCSSSGCGSGGRSGSEGGGR